MSVQELNPNILATAIPFSADQGVAALSGGPPPRGPYFWSIKPGATKQSVDPNKGTIQLAFTLSFYRVNDDGTVGDDTGYDCFHYEALPKFPAPLDANAANDPSAVAAYTKALEDANKRIGWLKRFVLSGLGKTTSEAKALAGNITVQQIVGALEGAAAQKTRGICSYIPPVPNATGLGNILLFGLADEKEQFLKRTGETGADGRPNYAIQANPPKAPATTAGVTPGALGLSAGALPGVMAPGALPGVGTLPGVPGIAGAPAAGLATAPGMLAAPPPGVVNGAAPGLSAFGIG